MTAVAGYVTAMADLRAKTRLRYSVSPSGEAPTDGAEDIEVEAPAEPRAAAKGRARGKRGGAGP